MTDNNTRPNQAFEKFEKEELLISAIPDEINELKDELRQEMIDAPQHETPPRAVIIQTKINALLELYKTTLKEHLQSMGQYATESLPESSRDIRADEVYNLAKAGISLDRIIEEMEINTEDFYAYYADPQMIKAFEQGLRDSPIANFIEKTPEQRKDACKKALKGMFKILSVVENAENIADDNRGALCEADLMELERHKLTLKQALPTRFEIEEKTKINSTHE